MFVYFLFIELMGEIYSISETQEWTLTGLANSIIQYWTELKTYSWIKRKPLWYIDHSGHIKITSIWAPIMCQHVTMVSFSNVPYATRTLHTRLAVINWWSVRSERMATTASDYRKSLHNKKIWKLVLVVVSNRYSSNLTGY